MAHLEIEHAPVNIVNRQTYVVTSPKKTKIRQKPIVQVLEVKKRTPQKRSPQQSTSPIHTTPQASNLGRKRSQKVYEKVSKQKKESLWEFPHLPFFPKITISCT